MANAVTEITCLRLTQGKKFYVLVEGYEMNLQKLYFRLYEKGKLHISKQLLSRSKVQQNQCQLPAIVNPTTRLSTRDKVWLSIGVFFSIVYIISAIVSLHIGTQLAIADQRAGTPATQFSSSTNLHSTPRTTLPHPPSVSIGKPPSISAPKSISAARPTPITFNPTSTPCPGVNCNPWGYNFILGNLIYNPPAGFCNYFACVSNFNKPHHLQNGYVVECNDGMYGQFDGERGPCGQHGGVLRALYAH